MPELKIENEDFYVPHTIRVGGHHYAYFAAGAFVPISRYPALDGPVLIPAQVIGESPNPGLARFVMNPALVPTGPGEGHLEALIDNVVRAIRVAHAALMKMEGVEPDPEGGPGDGEEEG